VQTALSRMNFSGYVWHVIIFRSTITTACCLVVELGLGLGFDSVSGRLVVMHPYFYYFRLSPKLGMYEILITAGSLSS